MEKLFIILDLDETLIHATEHPPNNAWDFEISPYKVYKRPGLDSFLEGLRGDFKIAVWSSATDDYVAKVVEKIFPPKYGLLFVWGRSKCTMQINYKQLEEWGYLDYNNHLNYAKILKKVKRLGIAPLQRILVVDDTPAKLKHNYGNAIYATEFLGDKEDDELYWLLIYLRSFKNIADVRKIEKRGWKKRLQESQ